jgi:hypothetical protein
LNVFSGNSNWRGPVWMPVNYLLIESLRRFHRYYGDIFRIECPSGSGQFWSLDQIADERSRRLSRLFLKDAGGAARCLATRPVTTTTPAFRDHVLFYDYFNGDTGRGKPGLAAGRRQPAASAAAPPPRLAVERSPWAGRRRPANSFRTEQCTTPRRLCKLAAW